MRNGPLKFVHRVHLVICDKQRKNKQTPNPLKCIHKKEQHICDAKDLISEHKVKESICDENAHSENSHLWSEMDF